MNGLQKLGQTEGALPSSMADVLADRRIYYRMNYVSKVKKDLELVSDFSVAQLSSVKQSIQYAIIQNIWIDFKTITHILFYECRFEQSIIAMILEINNEFSQPSRNFTKKFMTLHETIKNNNGQIRYVSMNVQHHRPYTCVHHLIFHQVESSRQGRFSPNDRQCWYFPELFDRTLFIKGSKFQFDSK